MNNQEQINGIKMEVCEMLEIIQRVHDVASKAMYNPTTAAGVNYITARHEQLQEALDSIRDELDTDWRYTP